MPLITTAGLIGVFLILGWRSLSTADFGIYHDDGIYAVTSRSLAETGEYRILSLPGEPFQRKYPIVFPAMLAGVWRTAGEFPANIAWLKAVSLLGGAAFLAFTFGLLRTIGAGGWTATVITGVCAFSPATVEVADSVMSELVYGAFSIGALWLLERAVREHSSPGLGLAAGLLAGLACQTRTVGVALVIALIAAMACRRRWRSLAGGIFGAGLAVGVCQFWQGPASPVPPAFGYYVSYFDWFLQTGRGAGWGFLAVVPLKNLLVSLLALVRTTLPEGLDIGRSAPWMVAVTATALLAGMALVPGLIRRGKESWAIYAALYFAIVLAWPFPSPPRFFVPVLPLVLLAAWEGIRLVRPPARLLRITATVAGAIFVVAASAGEYARLRNADVEPSLRRYEWIRNNTAPGDVIACVLDPNCYLYTGRKAVSLAIADAAPYYGSSGKFEILPEKMDEMIRASNAAYVMVEPFPGAKSLGGLVRDAVGKLQQDDPGRLQEVWRDDAEGAMIFRVRPRPLS